MTQKLAPAVCFHLVFTVPVLFVAFAVSEWLSDDPLRTPVRNYINNWGKKNVTNRGLEVESTATVVDPQF